MEDGGGAPPPPPHDRLKVTVQIGLFSVLEVVAPVSFVGGVVVVFVVVFVKFVAGESPATARVVHHAEKDWSPQ